MKFDKAGAMEKSRQRRMFTVNDPIAPQLSPELAKEIGLNESILLRQLEFLIAISDHEIEGKRWTYQSITDLEKMFPFWSRATINRIIHSLEELGLIVVANHNKRSYDRTRWFAMNLDGISKLRSVKVCTPQDGTLLAQNETGENQNETTIPEITTDIKREEKASSLSVAGEKPPATRERSKSAKDQMREEIEDFFSDITNIPIPKRNTEKQKREAAVRWWNPIREMLEMCDWNMDKTRKLIDAAYWQMRDGPNHLTVSSPQSILQVAVSIRADWDRDGDGTRIVVDV